MRLGPSTSTSSTRPTRLGVPRRRRRAGRPRSARSIRSRFTSSGTWSGMVGGLRPAARREHEREGAVEADLLDDLDRLRGSRPRSRRGSRRSGRSSARGRGSRRACRRRARGSARASTCAASRFRIARRAGLERQVGVLADGGALGHRCDHVGPEVLRVRAREADPLDPVDRVDGAQQLGEPGADVRREVPAVRVHVLAEQRDLADAVGGERRSPRRRSRPAGGSLAAAHRRDDAVRALRVAAHRDLHPRLERPLAAGAGARREAALHSGPKRPRGAVAPGPSQSPRCGIEPGPKATSTNGYRSKIRSRCASA